MIYKFSVILVVFAITVNGQPTNNCPAVRPMKDFDLKRFISSGPWLQQKRTPEKSTDNVKCNRAIFNLQSDKSIKMTVYDISLITNKEKSLSAVLHPLDPPTSGTFDIRVPTLGSGVYYVLGTDYENYAVTYTCNYPKYAVRAWIWTKSSNPSPAVIKKAEQIIKSNDIDLTTLVAVDQTNCPEF